MTIFKLPNWAENLAGKRWNHIVVIVLRLLVGATFLYSGFTKGVDPWGGYYKVADYVQAYGLDWLAGSELAIAIALAVFETVLGLGLLVGAWRRGSVVLLLLQMLVMTPLTLDLALTGRVPDCGCFGDALVLSNWATFWKNVALLAALLWLLPFNRRVHGVYGPAVQWMVGLMAFAWVACLAFAGYQLQPLVDYRPYPVGSMVGVQGEPDIDEDDYVFVYEKGGERREFTIDELPDDDSGWEFVDRRYKKGRSPQPIVRGASTLAILDSLGTDITEQVLPQTGSHLLLLFPDLANVNIAYTFNLNELNDKALKQGASVMGLTSATQGEIAQWNDISMASYPIYRIDDSQLKQIARGNPAVVFVDRGRVVWKRTLSSIGSDAVRDAKLPLAAVASDYSPSQLLHGLNTLLVVGLLLVLVVNRTHVLVLLLARRGKKRKAASTGQESDKET